MLYLNMASPFTLPVTLTVEIFKRNYNTHIHTRTQAHTHNSSSPLTPPSSYPVPSNTMYLYFSELSCPMF